MDKLKHFTDMEALYRKQADAEPAKRERHVADAEAWRLLADTKRLMAAKQTEMREVLASLVKPRGQVPPTQMS
jgi:hypothetical protein